MCQDNLSVIVKYRVSSTDWTIDTYKNWSILGRYGSTEEAIEKIIEKSSIEFDYEPIELKVLKSKQDFELELNENDLGWFEINCMLTKQSFQFFIEKSIKSPWEIGLNEFRFS
jgi:hypothetical protein